MTFGNLLREARLAKGLTQKQLAEQIHAKHNSVSNWENDQNRPDPDTIEYLCGALEVPVNYFFPQSSDKPQVSLQELEFIKKYRALDRHGKDMVDVVLEKEYARVQGTTPPLPVETVQIGNVAARGGGVHAPDEEELKDMQAVYEKLVLPEVERRKRRNQGEK